MYTINALRNPLLVLLLVWLCLLPTRAIAHPHEFVTMKISVLFDGQANITGLRYKWTFDRLFSAYALEGQDKNKNGKAEPDELLALQNEILGNIAEIKFFTRFDKKGVQPDFAKAKPLGAEMVKREFSMTFEVPFKTPLNVSAKPLRYGVFDDEYYISMLHDDKGKSVQLVGAPSNCKWDMEAPDPDQDMAAFAQSLDKTQSSGGGLGEYFAEWVTISCK